MLKKEVCGDSLSNLGFGLMRLPTQLDGSIDEKKTFEMIDWCFFLYYNNKGGDDHAKS